MLGKRFFLITLLFLSLSSLQAQIIWSGPVGVANSTFDNMRPRVMTSSLGPVVVWGRVSDNKVFSSWWLGSEFSIPNDILPDSVHAYVADWTGPEGAAS